MMEKTGKAVLLHKKSEFPVISKCSVFCGTYLSAIDIFDV